MEGKTVARKYKSRVTSDKLDIKIELQKEALCQTANCGRHKLRIDFGSFALSDCAA